MDARTMSNPDLSMIFPPDGQWLAQDLYGLDQGDSCQAELPGNCLESMEGLHTPLRQNPNGQAGGVQRPQDCYHPGTQYDMGQPAHELVPEQGYASSCPARTTSVPSPVLMTDGPVALNLLEPLEHGEAYIQSDIRVRNGCHATGLKRTYSDRAPEINCDAGQEMVHLGLNGGMPRLKYEHVIAAPTLSGCCTGTAHRKPEGTEGCGRIPTRQSTSSLPQPLVNRSLPRSVQPPRQPAVARLSEMKSSSQMSRSLHVQGMITSRENHELSPPTPSFVEVNDGDQAESLSNCDYSRPLANDVTTAETGMTTPGSSHSTVIPTGTKQKRTKPYPHSGSEKARRDRINESIDELRVIVPKCVERRCEGGKCDKASILKATVEHVKDLQAQKEFFEKQLLSERTRIEGPSGRNGAAYERRVVETSLQGLPRGMPVEGVAFYDRSLGIDSKLARSASVGTPMRVNQDNLILLLDDLAPESLKQSRTRNDDEIEVSVEPSKRDPANRAIVKILCRDQVGLLKDIVNALFMLRVEVIKVVGNTMDAYPNTKLTYDVFEIAHKGQNLRFIGEHLRRRLAEDGAIRAFSNTKLRDR
mmetsp:Transcript_3287/g.11924  ORF Transcript_3287/g.11924 Transcript_3287/m.11924 type:complete len:587 (-) Transcript_3287:1639-3399(-)